MKSIRYHSKKLSCAVALLLLLASVLLSVHYHSDVKTADSDNNCAICLIAHSFTKDRAPSGPTVGTPQSSPEVISVFSLPLYSCEQSSSILIRGPPLHS